MAIFFAHDAMLFTRIFRKQNWVHWLWALFIGLILVLAARSVGDYGVSWDEIFRNTAGEQKLAYYESLLAGDHERAAEMRGTGDRYPGLFDLLNAILRRIISAENHLVGHALSASFGVMGIIGCMCLARICFGPWAGLCAGIALACYLRYWGHMFINPKDIPFAATFVWGIWALMRVIQGNQTNWRSALLFGLLAGACMSVRIGGLLLYCYALLFLGLQFVWQWRATGWERPAFVDRIVPLVSWFMLSACTGFFLLALCWPAIHTSPFSSTSSTLSSVQDFGWEGIVRYGGEWLRVSELPRTYLLTWLGITVPDIWYWLIVSGLGAWLVQGRPWKWDCSKFNLLMLLFAGVFPIAFILLREATVYDGMRHILFTLPLFAACMGYLMERSAANLLPRGPLFASWIILLFLGLALVWTDARKLHPYQYVHFNYMSGGTAAQGQRYDTDYWGTAYREGSEWLSEALPIKPDGNSWRVTMEPPLDLLVQSLGKPVIPPPDLVAPFLREDIVLIPGSEAPELYIATTRLGFNQMRDGEVVYQVQRSGLVLLEIKRLP